MMRMKVMGCVRCGGDHKEGILFKPFQRAVGLWNLWGVCPTTQEPILACQGAGLTHHHAAIFDMSMHALEEFPDGAKPPEGVKHPRQITVNLPDAEPK